jgi:hypothetical protein
MLLQTIDSGALFEPIVKVRTASAFHHGWNRIPGIRVDGDDLEITLEYFIRREDVLWDYVPWEVVQAYWGEIGESEDFALEQSALAFIRRHKISTDRLETVLENAEKVYSFLFDSTRLAAHEDLRSVSDADLRVLRESSTLCAINRVNTAGRITTIGPAWYFAQCARVVYGLDAAAEARVDELFHGGFFNGPRLRDQVRAHTALAGKLVHGCQGSGHGSGGCVVAYGTDLDVMQSELLALRPVALGFFESLG